MNPTPKQGIVILHGMFRTQRSMGGLARFLEKQGFACLNIGYPSRKYALEKLVDHIHPRIQAFADTVSTLHFVGFSMGGLLIRAYLHKHRPRHLGRVVLLATPNHGSEVADALKKLRLYRWLYGPAGQQLITDQQAFMHHFGKMDYEVGIIAGNLSALEPISSLIIGKPSDGKVSVESTKLVGMRDHIIIRCAHSFFPLSRKVRRQTSAFLKNGRFEQL